MQTPRWSLRRFRRLPMATAMAFGPLAATAASAGHFDPYTAQSVTFTPGGTTIDPTTNNPRQVAEWIGSFAGHSTFQVVGFYCKADVLPNSTSDQLLELADLRATQLRDALVAQGVDATRLATIAYGSSSHDLCAALAVPTYTVETPLQGVGLAISPSRGDVRIDHLIAGAPADRDGSLKVGDIIVAVKADADSDWISVEGGLVYRAVSLIRGNEGTTVGIRVIHEGETQPSEIYLSRESIMVDAAKQLDIFGAGSR